MVCEIVSVKIAQREMHLSFSFAEIMYIIPTGAISKSGGTVGKPKNIWSSTEIWRLLFNNCFHETDVCSSQGNLDTKGKI